jgi:hypothetical protein
MVPVVAPDSRDRVRHRQIDLCVSQSICLRFVNKTGTLMTCSPLSLQRANEEARAAYVTPFDKGQPSTSWPYLCQQEYPMDVVQDASKQESLAHRMHLPFLGGKSL